MDVDLDTAETCAIVIFADKNWSDDPDWVGWAQRVSKQTDDAGLRARLFPVAIDAKALEMKLPEQAVRWDTWGADSLEIKQRRLLTALSYEFCRMLRFYLEHLERPETRKVRTRRAFIDDTQRRNVGNGAAAR
jgi:hypothetical protein